MFLTVAIGVLGFLVVILAIYVGGNWLLWHLKKPKAPSDESVRRYTERLLNLRWEESEDYFGQPIPNAIKNLYARTELIKRRNFQITNESGKSYEIAEFLPADLETLNRIWSDLKDSKCFPLATDSMGDCYYVPLSSDKLGNCPVMCYHHDGSDHEAVRRSLEELVAGIGARS